MKVSKQPKNRQRHPCQWLLEIHVSKSRTRKEFTLGLWWIPPIFTFLHFQQASNQGYSLIFKKNPLFMLPRDVVSLLTSVCLTSHTQLWQKNIVLVPLHIFLFSLLRWQSYLKLFPFFQLYNTIVREVTGPKINHLRSRTEPLNSFY